MIGPKDCHQIAEETQEAIQNEARIILANFIIFSVYMLIKILADPSKKLFSDIIDTSKSISGAMACKVVIDVISQGAFVNNCVDVSLSELAMQKSLAPQTFEDLGQFIKHSLCHEEKNKFPKTVARFQVNSYAWNTVGNRGQTENFEHRWVRPTARGVTTQDTDQNFTEEMI